MDHQTLAQLLGNYGEFLGAIAVVVTLGFLTLQIRQSTQANKSTFQLQVQSEFNRLSTALMNDESMGRLLELCRQPDLPTDLAPSDNHRLRYYVHTDLNTYAFVVMARQNQQIDEQAYGMYAEAFKQLSIEAYPALVPLYREVLVVASMREEPMFKPLYEQH